MATREVIGLDEAGIELEVPQGADTYLFPAAAHFNAAITTDSTIDGRDIATDGTKLDGIEANATADQTAAEILTAILTVDGSGSGLDADTVDGVEAAAFGLTANPLSQFAATTSAQLAGVMSDETGTGALVFANSPTLVTPALGTPSSGNLASCTAYEGTAVASTGEAGGTKFLREDGDGTCSWQAAGDALTTNPLSQFATTTSAQLAGVISDETGSGALVFATSPTFTTPALGTPASGNLSNCNGYKQVLGIAASDETTALTTGTGKAEFQVVSGGFTVTEVYATVTTAPVGSTIIVDINDDGTSILATKLTIDASEKTSDTAAAPYVFDGSPIPSSVALAENSVITIDIDQVGSGTAGAGLKVYLVGYWT